MKRIATATFAAAILAGTVAAAPAERARATDHEISIEIGNSETVAGGVPQGINPTPFTNGTSGGLECTKDPNTYCETILVELTNPYEEENARKGRERANVTFDLTTTDGLVSDYDFYVYESDAEGSKGTEVTNAGDFPLLVQSSNESATAVVTTTEEQETVWLLVEVYYFSAIAPYEMAIDFA